ncbi:MAG: hypothetical protein NC095_10145 [Muribaculum sp.]|nr:hypothetical protein [Muribaculum sp.]
MLIECSIMENLLDRRDREFVFCLLLHLVTYFPGYIHCRKGCVVTEGETFSGNGLPILKSGVLLCIAEQELNLKTGVIYPYHVGSTRCGVGTEENLPDGLASAGEFGYRHLDFAFVKFII